MSILFEPVVENGGFSQEYTEQEKKNLTEKIEGMNKVEFVGSRAFADCPKLTDINVPSSAEVDISAFDGSENVKK